MMQTSTTVIAAALALAASLSAQARRPLAIDDLYNPAMFMGGERDFNVPISGSEQMYQALRSLGADSQLVVYPNQNHSLTIPSYKRDRLERYLAWYGRSLKLAKASTSAER